MNIDADIHLRLSLQRPLLTHVTRELRSVSADVDPVRKIISLRFIFARPPSSSERDAASCAATQVIADYPASWGLEKEYPVVPAGYTMPHRRLLVYHRCEDDWVGPDA